MWLPCPTSAPAWNSSTWSTSSSPCRTSRVSQRSGKPNEKPTFLKPQAKPRPRRSASGCGGEGGEGRGRLRRRQGLGPVGGVGAAVDDHREADAGRHLGARRAEGPVAQQVAPAQLDRVHAQALGQLVHLGLGHERALRCAEAAEGAAGHGVGEHGEAVDGQVGDLVRARHAQVEVPEHLVGRVVVGAGVEVARGLRHHDPTVRRGPPPGVDPAAVALVVADHRLLSAPLAADGTALAAVGQPPRREGHDDLQRHVLPPAERAADGRVDDPHPLGREIEGVGDLLLVLVGPLAGDGHRDPTLVVDPADPGLGLQVGVLLVRQVVRPLDDDVGLLPARGGVALAQPVGHVDVGVGVEVGPDHHVAGQGGVDVGDDGQVLPLHVEALGTEVRRIRRLGHDDGDLVALPPADVGRHRRPPGVAQPDEDRLVEHGQAVLVDGHVGGGEHGQHPGRGLRRPHVHGQHAGVGAAGEDHAGVEHLGLAQVGRVAGLARHLGRGVAPWRRPADGRGGRRTGAPPAAEAAPASVVRVTAACPPPARRRRRSGSSPCSGRGCPTARAPRRPASGGGTPGAGGRPT